MSDGAPAVRPAVTATGHRLVLADAPSSQLDTATALAVMDVVDVLAAHGVTVVFATQDRRMVDGRVVTA